MVSVHNSYLGVAEESTYGTGVASTRFLEMVSEGLAGQYERIDSAAFRAGQRVLHADRFEPNPKGASGDLQLEVLDGTFGLLFKHCLGSATSGAPTGGKTTHTFTQGDLRGKSLTVQVGRVDNTGALFPFTYEGCKVTDWELTNAVDGILKLALNLDAVSEHIGTGAGAYAVSTPAYDDNAQLLTFVGGSVQVGGVGFAVSDVSIKGENGLKTDRYFLRGSTAKREPLEEGLRKYSFDLKGEFEGLSHLNRVASVIASGAVATLTATWTSPQGGSLVVSAPVARFDSGPVNFDGAKIIGIDLKGMILWDGTTSPVSIAYTTEDTTP